MGLSNVQQRIVLKYGLQYGMEIWNVSREGTAIIISLPVKAPWANSAVQSLSACK